MSSDIIQSHMYVFAKEIAEYYNLSRDFHQYTGNEFWRMYTRIPGKEDIVDSQNPFGVSESTNTAWRTICLMNCFRLLQLRDVRQRQH